MNFLNIPSFVMGELSEDLSGRTDLDWYDKGLALCKNFITLSSGGVSFRPGTKLVGETKYPERKTRLIPFAFSSTNIAVLEFGHLYGRIIMDGGYVVYPLWYDNYDEIVEFDLPYKEEDLHTIRFVQSADVVYLVHPKYPPARLERHDHHDWRYVVLTFAPQLTSPINFTGLPSDSGTEPYSYKVSAFSDVSGEEGPPSATITIASASLNLTGRFITLSWSAVPLATGYKIFKKEAGQFGLVGYSIDGSCTFIDDNIMGMVSKGPQAFKNPFVGTGNYPSVVAFLQQRLCFAASENEPQKIWMSRVASFENFSTSDTMQDDDSIILSIASNQVNSIRALTTQRSMLVLTGGGEWSLDSGAANGAITPLTLLIRQQSAYGTAPLAPIIVGSSILMWERGFASLRDLAYSLDVDGYAGSDLTVRARHLIRGRNIKAWAFQGSPEGVLWCVRDDGVLLGFTYLKEHQIYAWHQHHTDGFFEDVCTIGDDDADYVYVTVRRKVLENGEWVWKRFVERFEPMFNSEAMDLEESFFMDCGISYVDEYGDKYADWYGLYHLAGKKVSVLADGVAYTDLLVSEAGDLLLPEPAARVHVGLPYTGSIKTNRLNLMDQRGSSQGRKQTVVRVGVRFRDTLGGRLGKERYGTDGSLLEQLWMDIRAPEWASSNPFYSFVQNDKNLNLGPVWDTSGQFLIEQHMPLPMTILCLIPEVTLGER